MVTGLLPVLAFVAAMVAGMYIYDYLFERPVDGGVEANQRVPKVSELRYDGSD